MGILPAAFCARATAGDLFVHRYALPASQQKGPAGAGPLNNATETAMSSSGRFFLDD
jgi:hypothetical protein